MSEIINIAGDGLGIAVWEIASESNMINRSIGCVVNNKMINIRFDRDTSADRIARTFISMSQFPQDTINTMFGWRA